jgi:hypothetical protein
MQGLQQWVDDAKEAVQECLTKPPAAFAGSHPAQAMTQPQSESSLTLPAEALQAFVQLPAQIAQLNMAMVNIQLMLHAWNPHGARPLNTAQNAALQGLTCAVDMPGTSSVNTASVPQADKVVTQPATEQHQEHEPPMQQNAQGAILVMNVQPGADGSAVPVLPKAPHRSVRPERAAFSTGCMYGSALACHI